MAQEVSKQIIQLMQKGKRVLITTSRQHSGDGLASSLALLLILKKINKYAEVVIDSFEIPAEYQFLPNINEVKAEVKKLKKYIINLDISQSGLDELAYDIKNDNLRIHLSPKRGVFTPADLKFQTSEFAFDLIITVGAADLESLGALYDYHRDLFYQIPVINIDNSIGNDNYGHINLVDITATSSAEIIYQLIKDSESQMLDSKIATCLLTGMIAATRSFKSENVSPKSLTVASELIYLGANRQEIVTKLYQTKTIPTLKLWGKILSRLQSDQEKRLIWSKLDPHDFTDTDTNEKFIYGVVEELIAASPLAEVVVLFYQSGNSRTKVILHAQGLKNALSLVRQHSPSGNKDIAYFTVDQSLDKTEAEIINHLKTQL